MDKQGESPETPFEMPKLSSRQRDELLGLYKDRTFMNGRFLDSQYSTLFLHGTLRCNLIEKGLVEASDIWGCTIRLTPYGCQVAKHLYDDFIRRSGANMVAGAKSALRQADADARTPPSIRPGYRSPPVDSRSTATIFNRPAEWKELVAWLDDPLRQSNLNRAHSCGHIHTCRSCAELDSIRRALERALFKAVAEVGSLKTDGALLQMKLREARAAAQGLSKALVALNDAMLAAAGIDIKSQPTEAEQG